MEQLLTFDEIKVLSKRDFLEKNMLIWDSIEKLSNYHLVSLKSCFEDTSVIDSINEMIQERAEDTFNRLMQSFKEKFLSRLSLLSKSQVQFLTLASGNYYPVPVAKREDLLTYDEIMKLKVEDFATRSELVWLSIENLDLRKYPGFGSKWSIDIANDISFLRVKQANALLWSILDPLVEDIKKSFTEMYCADMLILMESSFVNKLSRYDSYRRIAMEIASKHFKWEM